MANHGSRKFRHQLFLSIFRVTEPAAHLPVQTLRCHGGVSHFMEHGRIILHSATVGFFRRITDIELRLHGQHHYILRGRIIGTVLTLVGTYRTKPLLRLHHTVECGMGVHTFRIPKFRNLEPVHKLLHPLRLYFCQIGLRHIVHRE